MYYFVAFQSVTALLCKSIIISSGEDVVVNYYGRCVRLGVDLINPVEVHDFKSRDDVNFLSKQINSISLNNSFCGKYLKSFILLSYIFMIKFHR